MKRYVEVVEGGRGPKVLKSKSPEDQDISNSNTSLTLKKVHLVYLLKMAKMA